MPRIRHIKPDFFASEDVSGLDFRSRLTWVGIWTQCDDHGRMKDSARIIKGSLWSLDDSVTVAEVEADLVQLASRGRIVRYQVDGARFLAVVNWHRHQRPNRPSVSKIPAPPGPIGVPAPLEDGHCPTCWAHESLTESALNGHVTVPEQDQEEPQVTVGSDPSRTAHAPLSEDSRREGEGEGGMERGGGARERATDPTPRTRPRCPRHANLADDDPGPSCRDCRDVRLAAEQTAAKSERDTRAAVRACSLCDGDGWRWVNPQRRSLGVRSGPDARCDHQPERVPT